MDYKLSPESKALVTCHLWAIMLPRNDDLNINTCFFKYTKPLLAQKCSVRTPPVSPNRALTMVSKQGLNTALTAFQFGGQTRC